MFFCMQCLIAIYEVVEYWCKQGKFNAAKVVIDSCVRCFETFKVTFQWFLARQGDHWVSHFIMSPFGSALNLICQLTVQALCH